jgi:hypothetical protein
MGAALIKTIMLCILLRCLDGKLNHAEVVSGFILLSIELVEYNVYFFFLLQKLLQIGTN